MAGDIFALLVPLLVLALCLSVLWHARRQHQIDPPPAIVQRLLKPRTPDDCATCRRQSARLSSALASPSRVRPWRERKRPRGAPKRIATAGFACPNRTCND